MIACTELSGPCGCNDLDGEGQKSMATEALS